MKIGDGGFGYKISISGAKIELISINMADDFATVIGGIFHEWVLATIINIIRQVVVRSEMFFVFFADIRYAFGANKKNIVIAGGLIGGE